PARRDCSVVARQGRSGGTTSPERCLALVGGAPGRGGPPSTDCTRCLAAATARGLVRRERANLAPRPRPPGLIAPSEVKDEKKTALLRRLLCLCTSCPLGATFCAAQHPGSAISSGGV